MTSCVRVRVGSVEECLFVLLHGCRCVVMQVVVVLAACTAIRDTFIAHRDGQMGLVVQTDI